MILLLTTLATWGKSFIEVGDDCSDSKEIDTSEGQGYDPEEDTNELGLQCTFNEGIRRCALMLLLLAARPEN